MVGVPLSVFLEVGEEVSAVIGAALDYSPEIYELICRCKGQRMEPLRALKEAGADSGS